MSKLVGIADVYDYMMLLVPDLLYRQNYLDLMTFLKIQKYKSIESIER